MDEPAWVMRVIDGDQSPPDAIDITGVTRLKHADLWAAAKKLATKRYGGQSALGRLLGVHPSEIGDWINLKACPPRRPTKAWTEQRLHKLECDLAQLTGKTLEELFPDALRDNVDFLAAPKTSERRFSVEQIALANYAAATRERLVAAAMPSLDIDRASVADAVTGVIGCLSHRERRVVEMRYGMNESPAMTYEQIGRVMGVTKERVRQIESKALRKLQRPEVVERLAVAVE